MIQLHKLFAISAVIAVSLGTIVYYPRVAERAIVSESRLVNTRPWLGAGGVHKRGLSVAEHRFRSASELRVWSESAFHKVIFEYHFTTETFEQVKTRWLKGDRAIYVQGQYVLQGGSYSDPRGPFEIVYDYEHDHLWTTLEGFPGHVSKQEFSEILGGLEHQ
jgi:hypothetical protein